MKINAPVIHYALAIAGLKGISLLMLPIVTRFLSPESYGELNFLVSIGAMLSIFLGFGMAEMMFQFTAKIASSELDAFITRCIKFIFLVSGVFVVIALVGVEFWLSILPLPIDPSHFIILMLNLAMSTIQAIYLTRYRVLQQSKHYMAVALCQGIAQATLTYTLLVMGLGILGVLISGCVTSFCITLSLVIYHRNLLSTKGAFLARKHIRYGAYIALSALFLYGLGGAENWFIASSLGQSQLAYYFIATQFVLALSLAFEPFRLWWYPVRFKRFFNNSEHAANGAILGCFIITLMALLMMIFAPTIISLLLPQSYHASSEYIAILSIILVIKTYSELLNLGCYLDKKTYYVPIINGICAVVALGSMAFAIPKWGINGVFTSLLTAHVLRLVAFYLVSQHIAPLNYQLKLVVTAFSLLLLKYLGEDTVWMNTVLLLVALLCCAQLIMSYKSVLLGDKHAYS